MMSSGMGSTMILRSNNFAAGMSHLGHNRQTAVVLARPAMKLRRLMGVAPRAEDHTLAHKTKFDFM